MKIMLGDYDAKLERQDIFKPTFGNDSLHQDSNDTDVWIASFATAKNLVVKIMMFPHGNIQQYTWTSSDGLTSR